ncbi:MAG: DegT/DnrJ/EryC1/StrS family aminotransferase [Thermoleophilia bacterium]
MSLSHPARTPHRRRSTGGEGGMLTTNDPEIWERVWSSYRDHGRGYDSVHERGHAPGFRRYIESFGSNRCMTEMQTAIGRMQLRKLEGWVAARRRNASILTERSKAHPHSACPFHPPT